MIRPRLLHAAGVASAVSKRSDVPPVEFRQLTDVQAEACRLSLAEFMLRAWHVVEPGRRLRWNWHLDPVCAHAEAVTRGLIRDMLVTIPFGTTKSRLFGVFWPAWVWLTDPGHKWLYIGNSKDSALTDSLACRRLVESDWYRRNFAITWALQDDQSTKAWYENTAGGHRIALGINSNVTARKGDTVVIDDPTDSQKVQSAAERNRVWSKFEAALEDRVIDLATGRHVIVGHRTHEDDLQGHLIRRGGYFELRIPEEFDPADRFTSPIGWTDPRKKKGELLRPRKFTPADARKHRRSNLLLYQAKHLQRPRSREGVRFKRAYLDNARYWFGETGEYVFMQNARGVRRFRLADAVLRFGTADPAASDKKAADFTCISAWLVSPWNDLLWIGCRRMQLEIPDQPAILAEEYAYHGMEFVAVEAEMSNVALLQHAMRNNSLNVKKVNTGGADKLARATPAIILVESGRMFLPTDDQAEAMGFDIDAVIDELTAFTGVKGKDKHDDVVDTLSYAVEIRRKYTSPSEDDDAGTGTAPGAVPPPGPAPRPGRPEDIPIGPSVPAPMPPGFGGASRPGFGPFGGR